MRMIDDALFNARFGLVVLSGGGLHNFRFCDVMRHGAIPVFVSRTPADREENETKNMGVQYLESRRTLPFSEFFDYSSFSVSVTSADLPALPSLLRELRPRELDRRRRRGGGTLRNQGHRYVRYR